MTKPIPFGSLFAVAGVSMDGRQEVAGRLRVDDVLHFVRVDDNEFDPFAVEIRTSGGEMLGFVPKALTERVRAHGAPVLDGVVCAVLDSYETTGLRVAVTGVGAAQQERTRQVVVSASGRVVGEYLGDVEGGGVRVRLPDSSRSVVLPDDNLKRAAMPVELTPGT